MSFDRQETMLYFPERASSVAGRASAGTTAEEAIAGDPPALPDAYLQQRSILLEAYFRMTNPGLHCQQCDRFDK